MRIMRSTWPFWAMGIVLFSIAIARALMLSITHDEALTYQLYVTNSYVNIINCVPIDANNHILHSLLAKVAVSIFGNAPWVLRLDNLLAFAAYMVFVYILLNKILHTNRLWAFCGFLILTLQPFLFDFWSLSRGYGLAIAMMMGSITFFAWYGTEKKKKFLYWSLVLSVLAVYSNFALLNYFAALCAGVFINSFLQPGKNVKHFFTRELPWLIISLVVICLLIATPLHLLKTHGQLYFGGEKGFLQDTVRTLIRDNSYLKDIDSPYIWMAAVAVAGITLVMMGYWLLSLKGPFTNSKRTGLLMGVLLIVPVVAIIVQHKLFDVKYVIERTALFLLPLFILALLSWLYHLQEQYGYKKLIVGMIMLLAAASATNFVSNLNLHASHTWRYDRDNLTVLKYIVNKEKGKGRKVKFCPAWIMAPSMQYYVARDYQQYFDTVVRDKNQPVPDDTTFDYYYMYQDDKARISERYHVDTTFPPDMMIMSKR